MSPSRRTHHLHGCYLFLAALLFGIDASAQTPNASESGAWQLDAGAYLWAAAIGGHAANGGEIDVGFTDIINALDMALMGHFNATRGQWRLSSDVIYLSVSANNGNDRLTARPGLSASSASDLSMQTWILTPGVNYPLLRSDQGSLDAMIGARFLAINIGIKTRTRSTLGSQTFKTSDSASVWDGIIGINGKVNLADNWTLNYYGDIGTGQSDRTWQTYVGVSYRFKYVDAVLGYRYLKWNFDQEAGLDNLILKGPMAGITYQFQ